MKIAGVQIEKYANGTLKSVKFDAKKYSEILKPILEDLGVLKDERLNKRFYSLEEAKEKTKKRLTDLCRKENLL